MEREYSCYYAIKQCLIGFITDRGESRCSLCAVTMPKRRTCQAIYYSLADNKIQLLNPVCILISFISHFVLSNNANLVFSASSFPLLNNRKRP